MPDTISILVKGKVQGVFYRQSTREKAEAIGVTGEVRNNEDGTVSIIASGNAGQLEQLIAWSKRGPSRAVVTEVIVDKLPYQVFEKFKVIR